MIHAQTRNYDTNNTLAKKGGRGRKKPYTYIIKIFEHSNRNASKIYNYFRTSEFSELLIHKKQKITIS